MNYSNNIIDFFTLPDDIKFSKDDYQTIWNMKPDKPHTIFIFGKKFDTPRLQQAYGKDYAFSGNTSKALPIPNIFLPLLKFMSDKYNTNFNMLLINWYRDGNDYIGMHSDDEKQISTNTPIITVSLGVTRDFVLQNKSNMKKDIFKVYDNSVLVMKDCQKTHKHGVPKRTKITESRISITLRSFI